VPSQCSLELHCCRYVVVRCNNELYTNDTTARFSYNPGRKRTKTVHVFEMFAEMFHDTPVPTWQAI
jgi:hypothetical protein